MDLHAVSAMLVRRAGRSTSVIRPGTVRKGSRCPTLFIRGGGRWFVRGAGNSTPHQPLTSPTQGVMFVQRRNFLRLGAAGAATVGAASVFGPWQANADTARPLRAAPT